MEKIIGIIKVKGGTHTNINYSDLDTFIKDIYNLVKKDVPFEITVFKNNIDYNLFVECIYEINMPSKYVVNVI